MFNEILELFSTGINACLNWFTSIFDRSGAIPYYMGILVIFMSFRYIISPIVGQQHGSDKAKKVKESEDG